ncbi:MAG: CapA family protein [Clostridia bacterium]|nr:CapA family protein [Clostridia bacterium]
MKKELTKRQKAIRKRRIFISLCSLGLALAIALTAIIVTTVIKAVKKNGGDEGSSSALTSSEESADPKIVSTATVINTGDILIHNPILAGALKDDGSYDFSGLYSEVKSYFNSADLAVANLEITLGGTQSGSYKGYPAFNIPDSIIDTVKGEGIDLLLTANNHSYDTGLYGFKRTVQVLKEKKIAYTGTRETATEPRYLVKNVNGVKIGMINYTYENSAPSGRKSLNGNIIAQEANDLINSFNYDNIDTFYTDAENMIASMKADGADAIVFYMHWGEEYQLKENTWQRAIAQRLCNLGVDVIVGGHPHVIQPIDLLYAEGSEHTTVCLYSLGNSISNQRLLELSNLSPNGHTEDGMLFSYTFDKYSDGTTILSAVDIVPCWVSKTGSRYDATYKLHPLENENSYKELNFSDTTLSGSYLRTKEIVGEGLTECQQYLGCEIRFK